MALKCILALTSQSLARAKTLSQRLNVPLCRPDSQEDLSGLQLVVSDGGLGLGFVDSKKGKPYYVDFLSNSWKARLRQGLAKSHIFRRALGSDCSRVVDATAGFGQDAVMAVALGCEVVAVERSPVVAEILRDGIERAKREDSEFAKKLEQLHIVEADALTYLQKVAKAERPDVVYLDPMFVKPKKTSKSPKEMQLLQELLEGTVKEGEDEALFAAAFEVALQRVVVKRPLKARALKAGPTHSFKGQSVRYDVYIKT